MYSDFHKAAILSCKVLLKPIIKLLLPCGLSFREFTEIAKIAYIEIATEDLGDPPNISLTAVRTGISRKAIKKLLKGRSEESVGLKSSGLYDLRVLELWRDNKRYQDKSGKPLHLYYSGKHDVTLLDLINELEADLPPSTILKRLLSTDLVDIDSEGRYFPRTSNPTPSVAGPDNLVRASVFAAAHVDTIANNISDTGNAKLLERQTFSVRVPKDLHRQALASIRQVCNEALSDIEKIMTKYEVAGRTKSTEMIGIGMYSFNYRLPIKDLSGVFDGVGSY